MNKSTIPVNAKRIALRPLALGEKTGHHHSLAVIDPSDLIDQKVEMYETEDQNGKRVFLRVTGDGVALVHQEHKPQEIPVGEYEVTIQSEVNDWGRSPVND